MTLWLPTHFKEKPKEQPKDAKAQGKKK